MWPVKGFFLPMPKAWAKLPWAPSSAAPTSLGWRCCASCRAGSKICCASTISYPDEPFRCPRQSRPRLSSPPDRDDYVMAPVSGILNHFVKWVITLVAGQPLGQIHSTELPFAEPTPVVAQTGGILFGRGAFPLTQQGACIATIVRPFALP